MYTEHVSVQHLENKQKAFPDIAFTNERILYHRRATLDPSFQLNLIIPTSPVPIDVVIPIVEKDVETAKYTIQSIKTMLMHKIGTIFLVAPENERIRRFAEEQGCTFILENKVLTSPKIKKYGGWIIQQFLKLSADSFVHHDHYFVIDADTVLIRPTILIDEHHNYIVNTHWSPCPNWKRFTARLLQNAYTYRYDFVGHNMLFSKKILRSMKRHIEQIHNVPWDLAILGMFEKQENPKDFSEYELYMTYLTEFYTKNFRFVSNANITVYRDFLHKLPSIIRAYASEYKSISLHHFVLFEKECSKFQHANPSR